MTGCKMFPKDSPHPMIAGELTLPFTSFSNWENRLFILPGYHRKVVPFGRGVYEPPLGQEHGRVGLSTCPSCCGGSADKMYHFYPLLPVAGRRTHPGVKRARELVLTITNYSPHECAPCPLSMQHGRVNPVGRSADDLAPLVLECWH